MTADAVMRSLSEPPTRTFVVADCKTVTEGNTGGHWRGKYDRSKAQRANAYMAALAHRDLRGSVTAVRLTRIAPRKLDSHDNVRSALKHVVDGIADAISPVRFKGPQGQDYGSDGPESGIVWQYGPEERGRPREYAVRVEMWTA